MSEAPNSLFIVLAAARQGVPSTDGGFGIGAVVLILVMVALLAWLAYLFVNSRRSRSGTSERLPLNQTPYMSDDELENVHTTRVLRAAVIAAVGMAILLPWYAFNEANRQAEAIETLSELDIEEGDKWFHQFECFACHGEDLLPRQCDLGGWPRYERDHQDRCLLLDRDGSGGHGWIRG